MTITEFLLGLLLISSVYRLYHNWSLKRRKNEYLISNFSKEEYQQMEKEVLEMLAERKNK